MSKWASLEEIQQGRSDLAGSGKWNNGYDIEKNVSNLTSNNQDVWNQASNKLVDYLNKNKGTDGFDREKKLFAYDLASTIARNELEKDGGGSGKEDLEKLIDQNYQRISDAANKQSNGGLGDMGSGYDMRQSFGNQEGILSNPLNWVREGNKFLAGGLKAVVDPIVDTGFNAFDAFEGRGWGNDNEGTSNARHQLKDKWLSKDNLYMVPSLAEDVVLGAIAAGTGGLATPALVGKAALESAPDIWEALRDVDVTTGIRKSGADKAKELGLSALPVALAGLAPAAKTVNKILPDIGKTAKTASLVDDVAKTEKILGNDIIKDTKLAKNNLYNDAKSQLETTLNDYSDLATRLKNVQEKQQLAKKILNEPGLPQQKDIDKVLGLNLNSTGNVLKDLEHAKIVNDVLEKDMSKELSQLKSKANTMQNSINTMERSTSYNPVNKEGIASGNLFTGKGDIPGNRQNGYIKNKINSFKEGREAINTAKANQGPTSIDEYIEEKFGSKPFEGGTTQPATSTTQATSNATQAANNTAQAAATPEYVGAKDFNQQASRFRGGKARVGNDIRDLDSMLESVNVIRNAPEKATTQDIKNFSQLIENYKTVIGNGSNMDSKELAQQILNSASDKEYQKFVAGVRKAAEMGNPRGKLLTKVLGPKQNQFVRNMNVLRQGGEQFNRAIGKPNIKGALTGMLKRVPAVAGLTAYNMAQNDGQLDGQSLWGLLPTLALTSAGKRYGSRLLANTAAKTPSFSNYGPLSASRGSAYNMMRLNAAIRALNNNTAVPEDEIKNPKQLQNWMDRAENYYKNKKYINGYVNPSLNGVKGA